MGCDAFHITGRENICSEILWFIVFKQRFPPEFFFLFVHGDSEMYNWTKAYFILKIEGIKKK